MDHLVIQMRVLSNEDCLPWWAPSLMGGAHLRYGRFCTVQRPKRRSPPCKRLPIVRAVAPQVGQLALASVSRKARRPEHYDRNVLPNPLH